GIAAVGLVCVEGSPYGADFAAQHLIVNAGPPPCHGIDLGACERRSDGACSGGISDSHFTKSHEPDTLFLCKFCEIVPCQYCLQGLAARHRRPFTDVMGTTHDLAADQTRSWGKIVIYAGINDLDFNPTVPGKHIDSCSAPKKIEHHLVRDFARICANTFAGYTVVSGSYVYPLFYNRGCYSFSDCGHLNANFLEMSKTTRRFGQAQMP